MNAAQIISELSRYGEFIPTRFDKVLQVQQGDTANWLVFPHGDNRDASLLVHSNFVSIQRLLTEIEEEGENWQVHRFQHWGPGWYEILIWNEENEPIHTKAIEIIQGLNLHPCVDEDYYYELLEEEDDSEESEESEESETENTLGGE